MLQKHLITILILLVTRFLDRISAQYLYLLAHESELLTTNDLLVIKTSSFYALKGFWNLFWWFLLIISIITSIGHMTVNRSINEELSDSEPKDDEGKKTESSESPTDKRPTRASRRYKSRRYKA